MSSRAAPAAAVSMIGMTAMTVTEEYKRQFWEKAVTLLLHPTQLLILEALGRLGMPVSAAMEKMSDGQIPLANWDYHLARLTKLGLQELIETRKRPGVTEKFFDLRLVKAE